MSFLSRRDFLKLTATIPTAMALFPWLERFRTQQISTQQTPLANIIIILFDAMSARDLSVYGYPRNTTPNLNRFASRANVYHSHDSAGNFTVPGTTSLLTGLYPWTHRAINGSGLMARELVGQNIFRLFHNQYKRLAFTQNLWANYLLSQFQSDIDVHLAPTSFDLENGIAGKWFKNDLSLGYRTFDDFLFEFQTTPASLLFGTAQRLFTLRQFALMQNTYSDQYAGGPPNVENYPLYYRLEDVFNGVITTIKNIKAPTFAYFHFFSPHEPYRPSMSFYSMFFDKYQPVHKPNHPLGDKLSQKELDEHRRRYDEYIADLDSQFGRLLDTLENSGFLDNSIVIVTADHGQLFERGTHGHFMPLMYDPVLHIPLLISTPGQSARNDIYEPTNSVDVLPTLLHLSNQPIPAWCEGTLLPGLGGVSDPERVTFSVEAKLNPSYAPLKVATIAMRKGPYKLIHYMGYAEDNGKTNYPPEFNDAYELYNLEADIEEMNDLYTSEPAIAAQMKNELLDALHQSNSHFKH